MVGLDGQSVLFKGSLKVSDGLGAMVGVDMVNISSDLILNWLMILSDKRVEVMVV